MLVHSHPKETATERSSFALVNGVANDKTNLETQADKALLRIDFVTSVVDLSFSSLQLKLQSNVGIDSIRR